MWIKICGLTDAVLAREISALKPDAIGLNFYERSVRHVSLPTARQIVDALAGSVETMGVFVETTAETIRKIVEACGLSGVQFHAAENAAADCFDDVGRNLGEGVRRIRAFQMGPRGLAPIAEYLEGDVGRKTQIDACLVDAHVAGQYGGTGKTLPWDRLQNEYQARKWPPLILAGGLRPENVAEAILTVRPWGVDVASGVESSPGVKDVELVARFIEEARRAFRELKST